MMTQVYAPIEERCDCGEDYDHCYYCGRRTPACPVCDTPTPKSIPVCHGEDGNCTPEE